MRGDADPQRTLGYQISLETFVPREHPLRAIRSLIDDQAIRRACRELYRPSGAPRSPPEQLFLANALTRPRNPHDPPAPHGDAGTRPPNRAGRAGTLGAQTSNAIREGTCFMPLSATR